MDYGVETIKRQTRLRMAVWSQIKSPVAADLVYVHPLCL